MACHFAKLKIYDVGDRRQQEGVKKHTCMTIFISRVFPSFLPVKPQIHLRTGFFSRESVELTVDSINIFLKY